METNNQSGNHVDYFTPKILWSIIGFLLLVVIVGSVLWWQETKKTDQALNQQNTCLAGTPAEECNDNPAQNSTANWKTYSNSEFSYEFKHPASKVSHQGAGPGQFLVSINYDNRGGLEYPRLEISNAGDWRLGATGDNHLDIKPIKATSFSGSNSIGTFYEGENPIEFTMGNHYVYANCINYDKEPDVISFCNQVLATFKFTDSLVPANWKTYTNSQNNYSFKYPPELSVKEYSNGTVDILSSNSTIISLITSSSGGAAAPITDVKTIGTHSYKIRIGNEYLYTTTKDNMDYTFETKQANVKVLEQILSSFKFTE
jgi:hypothetical protein